MAWLNSAQLFCYYYQLPYKSLLWFGFRFLYKLEVFLKYWSLEATQRAKLSTQLERVVNTQPETGVILVTFNLGCFSL